MTCCEYSLRDHFHISFSFYLTNGSKKIECLSLESLVLQLIGSINKLRRKYMLCIQSEGPFSQHLIFFLHFLSTLQMGPKSQSVCLLKAQSCSLLGQLISYEENTCCEYSLRDHFHISFSFYLTNGSEKLECLSLESLYSLV